MFSGVLIVHSRTLSTSSMLQKGQQVIDLASTLLMRTSPHIFFQVTKQSIFEEGHQMFDIASTLPLRKSQRCFPVSKAKNMVCSYPWESSLLSRLAGLIFRQMMNRNRVAQNPSQDGKKLAHTVPQLPTFLFFHVKPDKFKSPPFFPLHFLRQQLGDN